MQFTQVSAILAILALAPSSVLCAPSLCNGPPGSGLVDCTTPDSSQCTGDWWQVIGGTSTQIQTWSWGANNVNTWDQHKFSQELIRLACSPSDMKSSYDPTNLIAAASWRSGGTCTPGRVTEAIKNSAGLRHVDCQGPGEHPDAEFQDGLDAGVHGAMAVLEGLGGDE